MPTAREGEGPEEKTGLTKEKPNLRAEEALAHYARGRSMTPFRASILKHAMKVTTSQPREGEIRRTVHHSSGL